MVKMLITEQELNNYTDSNIIIGDEKKKTRKKKVICSETQRWNILKRLKLTKH